MTGIGINVQISKVTAFKRGNTHNFCHVYKIGFIQGLVIDTLKTQGYILKAVIQQCQAKVLR